MWKVVFLTVLTFQVFANVANAFRDEMTIGDGCEGNDDCVEIGDAVCDLEECVCRDHFVASPNKTVCLKMASEPGDDCEISEQCKGIPLATCVNRTCWTGDDMSSANESVRACGNGSDCSRESCQNGTCVEESFQMVATKLLDLDIIGRRNCSNDSDCRWADESICFEGKCRCKPDFVPSQNLKTCLVKARSLGDDCIESVQCHSLNESVCMNKKCTEKMKSFFKSFPDDIPTPLILGSSCNRNEECSGIANSFCNENICECTNNYVTSVSSNSCLLKSEREGDACEIDKQCERIKGAFCTGKKCLRPASLGRSLEKPRNAAAGKASGVTAILSAILILKICLV